MPTLRKFFGIRKGKNKSTDDHSNGKERYQIEICVEFCYGHRLVEHESKCKNLHGHNCKAVVRVSSNVLDKVGRVVDFSTLKKEVRYWIEQNWDHSYIYNPKDEVAVKIMSLFPQLKLRFYNLGCEPTAENMAKHLYHILRDRVSKLGSGELTLDSVTIYETPDNCATYMEND